MANRNTHFFPASNSVINNQEVQGLSAFPREIIIEIFRYCLPELPYRPNPRMPPILLTHVCSSWRTLASQLPELWQSIRLTMDEGESPFASASNPHFQRSAQIGNPGLKVLEQLGLWERNGDFRPLHLQLDLPWPIGDPDMDDVVVKILTDSSQRLHRLAFSLYADDANLLDALAATNYPILEALEVTFQMAGLEWDEITATASLTAVNAPRLRRVMLHAVPRLRLDFPWNQLTHLEVKQYHPPSFFRFIMTNCPNLRRLALDLHGPFITSGETDSSRNLIVMSSLRKLSLNLRKFEASLFHQIHFPVLEDFRLFNEMGIYMLPWVLPFSTYQTHIISQLQCLRSLILGNQTTNTETILGILRSTPRLVDLTIDSDLGNYTRLFTALAYSQTVGFDNIIVPNLEKFSLTIGFAGGVRPLFFATEPIFHMITSRNQISSQKEDVVGDASSDRPSRLADVFLYVADTNETRHILDSDPRVALFSEGGQGLNFVCQLSADKRAWREMMATSSWTMRWPSSLPV
ncbi:hypothetical protein CVT26_003846 [Gymnopilus dilepis]|uniref:F-box domain-containing protein n=1 Tax=Gymnopilus dilepis TaxID=231916 RepID=A0A409YV20_9AGAR|nr:hypothetical protein CVT26_003846 [Gymnopilus dilepis]